MKAFFLFVAVSLSAAEPITLKLWPEGAPGERVTPSKATIEFVQKRAGKSTLTDVKEPTLTVYRPNKPNGTSVIVAPGGGYAFLSAVHEGTQVCEWLQSIGVTGILLTYRTPTRDEAAPHAYPVQDAQKALEIVRNNAEAWKLNPKRVGLLGFSAGGNLLAHLACDRDKDSADALFQRPDFGIMIYGGGFLDPNAPTKLKTDFKVPSGAPPMFMACAHDDGANPVAATLLYLEYKKQNLPAELHLFTQGGHGFGMRAGGQPIHDWPTRCAEWMDSMGWLPTVAKLEARIAKGKAYSAEQYAVIQPFIHGCDDSYLSVARIKELKLILSKLPQDAQTVEKQKFEKELKALESHIQELEKHLEAARLIDVEQRVKDLERTKNNLFELEAERDWLLMIQR